MADCFLKINFAPFLAEVDLWAAVLVDGAKVTLGDGWARLELRKVRRCAVSKRITGYR